MLTVAMMRQGDKLSSYKNLGKAFAQISSDYELTVIGDGDAAPDVKAALPDHTKYIGTVTDKQTLAAYYQSSDIFLWPGINEAFGMVYLEAQYHGLPVIAEDRMGVRDVVRDGGILTPADDANAYTSAINKMIKDHKNEITTRLQPKIR